MGANQAKNQEPTFISCTRRGQDYWIRDRNVTISVILHGVLHLTVFRRRRIEMKCIFLRCGLVGALLLGGGLGIAGQQAAKHAIAFDDLIKLHRIAEPQVSPDGKMIAFTSLVYPDCKDDDCNSKRDAEKEKSKVKVHVAEHLLYRHWTHWNEGKRSHLFVVPADGSSAPRDLTPGANYDVPPDERGGPGDTNFSPDGKEICFTAVTDKMEAVSTNGDLFIVPVEGGEAKRITTQPGF